MIANVKNPLLGKGENHSCQYQIVKPCIFSFFSQIATVHHCKGLLRAG